MEHPAKYSKNVLSLIRSFLGNPAEYPDTYPWVLDPFAGTGLIHQLRPDWNTVGIEIEPEWAEMNPHTLCGDTLLILPYMPNESFHAVTTSPCFGNRMADHHNATDDSRRMTYKHVLGRDLTPGNAAAMQWGNAYRELHAKAWEECVRVLRPGGAFILHMSDHIRKGEVQPVTDWHINTIKELGLKLITNATIEERRMKFGANRDVRVVNESMLKFQKKF